MNDYKKAKKALAIFLDYHNTALSSSQFLKKYSLQINALDNEFLANLAKEALEDFKA